MTNEVREALREIEAHADDSGDGKWLEELVRVHGPAIRHWNVDAVHQWREWPERTTVFPDSSPEDIAIDLVAEDAAGKRLIPIQCKARREGSAILYKDVKGFLAAAAAPEFKEAWIIGTTGPSAELREQLNSRGLTKVRCLRLQGELLRSAQADDAAPDPRDEIQRRVIDESLKGLENVRGRTHKGWRATDARGRIVMPCGTGKTRVGYRIAPRAHHARENTRRQRPADDRPLPEHWTGAPTEDRVRGDGRRATGSRSRLSPSARIEPATARDGGSSNVDEAIADDPTADLSGIDGSEITGAVRRKAQDIADWITERDGDPCRVARDRQHLPIRPHAG